MEDGCSSVYLAYNNSLLKLSEGFKFQKRKYLTQNTHHRSQVVFL